VAFETADSDSPDYGTAALPPDTADELVRTKLEMGCAVGCLAGAF
jgi:hypothetical protein